MHYLLFYEVADDYLTRRAEFPQRASRTGLGGGGTRLMNWFWAGPWRILQMVRFCSSRVTRRRWH